MLALCACSIYCCVHTAQQYLYTQEKMTCQKKWHTHDMTPTCKIQHYITPVHTASAYHTLPSLLSSNAFSISDEMVESIVSCWIGYSCWSISRQWFSTSWFHSWDKVLTTLHPKCHCLPLTGYVYDISSLMSLLKCCVTVHTVCFQIDHDKKHSDYHLGCHFEPNTKWMTMPSRQNVALLVDTIAFHWSER